MQVSPRAVAAIPQRSAAGPNFYSEPMSKPVSPQSERWRDVFRMMESLAPRVGNQLVDMFHEVAHQVQDLVPQMQVQAIFVCRGTERFQLHL